ncbi:hypothetical protein GUJ93_ZPchr0002g25805 [Zizania palustris]|uniref:Uncharacterized protein n=1 Tax=Zizania palustris TaxID=103762 RepID=A0A8J5S6X3_ZIZPA|nr:hypothetical protein GUJ93_ZPchr0002g25805 [Zizania palustris]
MGNALAGKRRVAKVMTVDGATFRYKTPATAGAALRGHPAGHQLLESEEVRRLGVRARPLERDAPLKPGKLYFLVQLPRGAGFGDDDDPRAPRKTWSGALHVGARERLESLMLSRRTVSDMASVMMPSTAAAVARATAGPCGESSSSSSRRPSSMEVGVDGAVRLRLRLPKSEVARLMKDSKDATEAAEKIMQLCVARDQGGAAPALAPVSSGLLVSALSGRKTAAMKKEKRTRFEGVPDEIFG